MSGKADVLLSCGDLSDAVIQEKESMVGGTRVIGVHGVRLLDLNIGGLGNKSGPLWCR